MQTLKTAIVVLLLMTVMYGSYVSLTTPPEPLPEAIASLIEESGDFSLDIDLGMTQDDSTQPGAATAAIPPTASDLPLVPSTPDLGLPEFASSAPVATTPPVIDELPSFSAPAIPDAATSSAVTGSLSDNSLTLSPPIGNASVATPIEQLQLPKPEPGSLALAFDTARDYPATDDSKLALPDPTSLDPLPPGSNWKSDATPVGFEMPIKDAARPGLSAPPSLKAGMALPTTTAAEPNMGLANAIRTADRQYAADQHAAALATLSLFYNTPDLSPVDREALISRLDPLAASVIYSRRHLLEQPHRVGANETLMEIAARYELPWQLLANVNGVDDPVSVLPGTELKVFRGPFRAEVDLAKSELTIFLGDMYAGRFGINVGDEPAPQAGTYTIQDKQTTRTFYDKNGSPVPPGDARNPYGSMWMDLGKQLCIHGSPSDSAATPGGCISLRSGDADDLYGILSQGSTVTIRR